MSAEIEGVEIVDAGPATPVDVPGAGAWRISAGGLRTVIGLELSQRVRSRRWLIVLGLWFCLVGGLTVLVRWAVSAATTVVASPGEEAAVVPSPFGRVTFAVIVFMVLSLGGLIAPALSATSINGDRLGGVLAVLQTTLLSPAEIVLGKLVAAWSIALALLAVASPFLLWAIADGGTSLVRVLTTLALLALTLLVVCAIGLGWSALTARTATSAVLTYLTVAALGLGLPALFALTLPAVSRTEQVRVTEYAPPAASVDPDDVTGPDVEQTCTTTVRQMRRAHTELNWWILAPSPYVVVADAAPRPDPRDSSAGDDPLTLIGQAVRLARLGPSETEDWCGDGEGDERLDEAEGLAPAWPWGLAADLALGGVFVVAAVRRLRAPMRRLPSGVRVA
ncbi:MAG: ABC transporter permease subunit [Kineosporiaceae bacterium]